MVTDNDGDDAHDDYDDNDSCDDMIDLQECRYDIIMRVIKEILPNLPKNKHNLPRVSIFLVD